MQRPRNDPGPLLLTVAQQTISSWARFFAFCAFFAVTTSMLVVAIRSAPRDTSKLLLNRLSPTQVVCGQNVHSKFMCKQYKRMRNRHGLFPRAASKRALKSSASGSGGRELFNSSRSATSSLATDCERSGIAVGVLLVAAQRSSFLSMPALPLYQHRLPSICRHAHGWPSPIVLRQSMA
jgi:hypothetical protein